MTLSHPSPIKIQTEERLEFFFEGDDFFASLEAAIDSATSCIDIECYYFASDELGWGIARRLIKKAAEGISVRLVVDAIGCRNVSMDLFDALERGGVSCKIYNPLFPFVRRFRRRNHRKAAVIDKKIGFIGGYNLAEEYSQRYSGPKGWRDTGVKITDPELIQELSSIFEESWKGRHRKLRDFIKKRRHRTRIQPGTLHIIPNYGWGRRGLIRREYLRAILHAKQRVKITNPYFVPDPGILWALRKAARRGVAVSILTAGVTDVHFARWAGHATYSGLLRAGVRIFEYQTRVMHAKSAVIDEEWFTVGTSNFDHLSFFKNLEVNLFGKDTNAASILSKQFEADLSFSREITREQWDKRSWLAKSVERFFFWFREWL